MAGMALIAVANVLGHADTRMVEKHYGHLSPSYIREAVRATALDLGPIEGNVVTISGRMNALADAEVQCYCGPSSEATR